MQTDWQEAVRMFEQRMCARAERRRGDPGGVFAASAGARPSLGTCFGTTPLGQSGIVKSSSRQGYGVEDVPDLNSQLLRLRPGELYWIGTYEIMRIL